MCLLAATASAQLITPSRLPWTSTVSSGFEHKAVYIDNWDWELSVTLTEMVGSGADLYVRFGAPATLTQFDASSVTPGTSNESIFLDTSSVPALTVGTWYISIWRPLGTLYDLDVQEAPVVSPIAGLGAVLHPGGTSFRVWAPNATQAYVLGTFNGWNTTLTPMASEGASGNWSLDIRGISANSVYKFGFETPSGYLWRNDPRALRLTNSSGSSMVVAPDGFDWGRVPYSTPAWNEMVVYELHPGSFNDLPGGPTGTFDTARLRIPYLADLGVNVIEVMPAAEFPGDNSWGYNPSYPFAVEIGYGGPEAFKRFVRDAHDNGIAVLLDVVYNHFGPGDLDMWQFDGWNAGGWGGIYFYNSSMAQTPWGDTKPDYGRPEVRQYIRDNVLFWLDQYRLDGLRWDSTSEMRMGPFGDIPEAWSLMQWINDEINATQPWKINTAEDLFNAPNPWITKDTGAGGAGFDAQWDAVFVHPVRAALITVNDVDRDMFAVRDAIQNNYNGDAYERIIYTESHDEVANGSSRVPEEIWPDNADSYFSKKRSTLGAAVVLTAPGIPMLFQGQEILEDGFFADDDPVDWSKLTTFAGIHTLYRDLIGMRRNFGANTKGLSGQSTNVFHTNNNDKLIAMHRWDQGGVGDDVIVILNFSNATWSGNYTIGMPHSGDWHVRFNSDWDGYDASFGNHPSTTITAVPGAYDGMLNQANISIGPYTALVLSQ